ncbi:hypothetical protein [Paenibacillus sp. FSL K6-2859]
MKATKWMDILKSVIPESIMQISGSAVLRGNKQVGFLPSMTYALLIY